MHQTEKSLSWHSIDEQPSNITELFHGQNFPTWIQNPQSEKY